MKRLTIVRTTVTAVTCSLLLLAFGSCINKTEKKCCEGYTGKITNEQALKLVNTCHFLSKDSIEIWTKKYEAYKKRLGGEKDTVALALDKAAAGFLKGGAVSFNSCIVKKILCHENSIGLRVLYGIDGNGKIHIILVGIQPDYSNLYVNAQNDCCGSTAAQSSTAAKSTESAPDEDEAAGSLGGAEYGQMP
jgi:hypothetical protein